MQSFLKKHQFGIVGIFVGGILGFAYYYFVGCNSGTCAITSKPVNSSVYGMVMGYLALSMFQRKNTEDV